MGSFTPHFYAKKFCIIIFTMTKNEISNKIVENEMVMLRAIWDGHKPNTSDQFQSLRVENEILRCLYHGEDSSHCKRQYRK
jgi:CRISPR/Cas system type I-B associated protein Csh2 (Cas7 group RAMP superfamily)